MNIISKYIKINIKKLSKVRVEFLYTICFALLALVAFYPFMRYGKSLVWNVDGTTQHLKALIFYSKWLRHSVLSILSGNFDLPSFSFSLGMGEDILTTLHYYAIGDPLNILSALVPTRFIPFFYSAMVVVRIWLSGLSFIIFTKYLSPGLIEKKDCLLVGALSYAFSSYTVNIVLRHPFFANPLIDLPLILLGLEMVLREKKPKALILSVLLASVSSVYFFYTEVMLAIIFFLFRLFTAYYPGTLIGAVKKGLESLFYAAAGLLAGGIVTVPVILRFLSDPRKNTGSKVIALYPDSFYKGFLAVLFQYGDGDYWTFVGMGAFSLIAICLMLSHLGKGGLASYKRIALFFCFTTALMLIPFAGYFLCGMTYPTNRWEFGYILLISYMISCAYFEMVNREKKSLAAVMTLMGAFSLAVFLINPSLTGTNDNLLWVFVIAFALLSIAVAFDLSRPKPRFRFFSLALFGIFINLYYAFSPTEEDETTSFASNEKWESEIDVPEYEDPSQAYLDAIESNFFVTEAGEVREVADRNGEAFARYSGNNITRNASVLSGVSSAQYYWSISNPYIADFLRDVAYIGNKTYSYAGFDDRTILNILSGVNYYTGDAGLLPYGSGKEAVNLNPTLARVYPVYENELSLPFGYTYDRIIEDEDYEKLSPLQRQNAFLSGVTLDEAGGSEAAVDGFGRYDGFESSPEIEEIPYEVKFATDDVSFYEGSFVTTAENSVVTLEFEGPEKAETYLYVDGLNFEATDPLSIYNNAANIDPLHKYGKREWERLGRHRQDIMGIENLDWEESSDEADWYVQFLQNGKIRSKKRLEYRTPYDSYYYGRHEFLVNSVYSDEPYTSIDITLNKIGTYSFDRLKLYSVSMSGIEEKVEDLSEEALENVDFHQDGELFSTNEITSDITLSSNKVLLLPIPYSKGWKAYVDGESREIFIGNKMFMAIPLESGHHDITLAYRTYGKTLGLICSGVGIIMILMIKLTKPFMSGLAARKEADP